MGAENSIVSDEISQEVEVKTNVKLDQHVSPKFYLEEGRKETGAFKTSRISAPKIGNGKSDTNSVIGVNSVVKSKTSKNIVNEIVSSENSNLDCLTNSQDTHHTSIMDFADSFNDPKKSSGFSFKTTTVQISPEKAQKEKNTVKPIINYATSGISINRISISLLVVSRDLFEEFSKLRSETDRSQTENSLRVFWIKETMSRNPFPPTFNDFLQAPQLKSELVFCPLCKQKFGKRVICCICGRTLCSYCVSHDIVLDDPPMNHPILTFSLTQDTVVQPELRGSLYVTVCSHCVIFFQKWRFVETCLAVSRSDTALFLKTQFSLFMSIETTLPQMTGVAMTIDCLRAANADSSSEVLLLDDLKKLKSEVEQYFVKLKRAVKQASVIEFPSSLVTMKRVYSNFSVYGTTFMQDKWLEFKKVSQHMLELEESR